MTHEEIENLLIEIKEKAVRLGRASLGTTYSEDHVVIEDYGKLGVQFVNYCYGDRDYQNIELSVDEVLREDLDAVIERLNKEKRKEEERRKQQAEEEERRRKDFKEQQDKETYERLKKKFNP